MPRIETRLVPFTLAGPEILSEGTDPLNALMSLTARFDNSSAPIAEIEMGTFWSRWLYRCAVTIMSCGSSEVAGASLSVGSLCAFAALLPPGIAPTVRTGNDIRQQASAGIMASTYFGFLLHLS